MWAILPKKVPRQSNLRRIQAKIKAKILTNKPEHIHLKGPQTLPRPRTHHSMITSLFATLPSGKNGTRQGIIQTNKSSSSLQEAQSSSKVSLLDMIVRFPPQPESIHSQKVAVLHSELATN